MCVSSKFMCVSLQAHLCYFFYNQTALLSRLHSKQAYTVVKVDKEHWWTHARRLFVMSRVCNWWNPTPPAGRSCVGVKTGPLASVQVKAHSRNHRLEVKPRRAGSAVVLETTEKQSSSCSFNPTQQPRRHCNKPTSRSPSKLSIYAAIARFHFG